MSGFCSTLGPLKDFRSRKAVPHQHSVQHNEERICYLSKVQGDVDLVELQPPGKRGALPPALCAINGVCDGVGFVAVCRGADVAVLALEESTKTAFNSGQKNMLQSGITAIQKIQGAC